VDAGSAFLPTNGGLRLSWMTQPDRTAPPAMHAGDAIAVLTQAKLPQVYRDEGAFDRRAYLSQHGVDLVAALRAGELLELVKSGRPSVGGWISRVRRNLREEIDALWPTSPRVAGVMRAMLLGDRTFIEREEAQDFQKTGAFHVLVGAGLHVGAIAMVLFWFGRKLKWPRLWTMSLTLLLLLGYVSVVRSWEDAVSPYLWARGFKTIDVVALTHAHQDHLGGLTAILENFRVGKLWIGREVKNPAMVKLETLARERHVLVERESRSKTFSLDGAEGEFVWPDDSNADAATSAKNNDSLVLRLKFGKETLLLPGDAEKQAERTMLAEHPGDELHADVLKVGHHGSKNSTTQEFLEARRPKIAIISAGEDNPYGHPSRELLERLENAGVRVLRTNRNGAVHIVTDGEKLDISCFVPCQDAATVAASRRAEAPDQEQHNKQ
jgi:beta-lactamase superfamily II metal-dependent hydrolase